MSIIEQAGKPELVRKIIGRIAEAPQGDGISFYDYMNLCLYDPEFGYYTGEKPKVGKEGDFYTSALIGGLMGEMIAAFVHREAPAGRKLHIVEWGAGTGAMALQMLDALKRLQPERYDSLSYTIIEISPFHRKLQAEKLLPHEGRVRIASPHEATVQDPDAYTFVFSNELLDSFPVHRVRMRAGELMELRVGWQEREGGLTLLERPCGNPALLEYLGEGGIRLREGQTADINLGAPEWIRSRLTELHAGKGMLLTIDYGDRAEELYAAHRMNGTLVCYRRHQATDEPLRHAGEQDMTAHVDFSACLRAGEGAGVSSSRLMTQREFLVEAGILAQLQNHAGEDPFGPIAKRNRAIRQLLLSDQMSELFKVLIQSR